MKARQIIVTEDGSHSIFSDSGIGYHSRHGAVQESRHIFIEAALYYLIPSKKSISILEIGFGTGLNAFMTYLETMQSDVNISYHTYELYPLVPEEVALLNYPEILKAANQRNIFEQLHHSAWKEKILISERFHFCKFQQSFLEIDAFQEFDIIHFDPFAPDDQPEFWEKSFLQKMYRALKPGGILTTYCAKGLVKRTLREVGFEVERLPGPPGKREMTRAKVADKSL